MKILSNVSGRGAETLIDSSQTAWRGNNSGSSTAFSASYFPSIAVLTDGMSLYLHTAVANTTATPTFTPNPGVIAAKPIGKGPGGSPLTIGDIAANGWAELRYSFYLDKWILANPSSAQAVYVQPDEPLNAPPGSVWIKPDSAAATVTGADGRTVLNGTSSPTINDGFDGDFWLNTTTWAMYGPKTSGAWGSPHSLVGPAGTAGTNGTNGIDGAKGDTGTTGTKGDTGATGAAGSLDYRVSPYYFTDFLGISSASYSPCWQQIPIGTGSLASADANIVSAMHQGVAKLKGGSSGTSGIRISTDVDMILLGGNEQTESTLRFASFTTEGYFIGFTDTTGTADGTDGAYFVMTSAGVFAGRTSSNSTRSTTGTNYTCSLNTWYRFKTLLNSNATRVDFSILDEAGNVLWTDYLTTNIPTASTRQTGNQVVAWTSNTGSIALAHIDSLLLKFGPLTR